MDANFAFRDHIILVYIETGIFRVYSGDNIDILVSLRLYKYVADAARLQCGNKLLLHPKISSIRH